MRPYCRFRATIGLTLTSVKNEDLAYLVAAFFPDIISKVNAINHSVACLGNHLSRMLIIAIKSISTIIRISLRQCYRADNIKIKFKLSIALIIEIISDTTNKSIGIVSFRVGYLIVQGLIVTTFEFFIRKLSKNDQSFLFPGINCMCTPHSHITFGFQQA